MLPTSVLEEGRESIFQTTPEKLQRWFQKPWHILKIFRGAAASVGDNPGGRGICWKSQVGYRRLATKVLDSWRIFREPQQVLHIFGRVPRQLVLIAVQRQRAVAAGKDYWPRTDVCCRYLVGVYVGLVYLGWYRCQLRTSIPKIGVLGRACILEG